MIQDIKNVLYASDLGESSKPAFYMAAREASRHKAQMTFLHVVDPGNTSTKALVEGFLSMPSMSEMRNEGIVKLKSWMSNRIEEFCLNELSDHEPLQQKPLSRVEEGPAAETIIRVADEMKADLIVMGSRTRTHSLVGRFFLGSTAQAVLQLSDRPVMVVPIK
ncbi:universal stress protein [Amphritea sp.]|uniref:universal stress protein n=1 Tax=Amphritea sp. TaxID=1872502 RepID=UPI003D09D9D5